MVLKNLVHVTNAIVDDVFNLLDNDVDEILSRILCKQDREPTMVL